MKLFKERYLVSICGDVFDTKRQKWLKKYNQSVGYKQVCINGKKMYLHRVVAECFMVRDAGMQVDHIDMDKSNNCLLNLEWVTRNENLRRYCAAVGKRVIGGKHKVARGVGPGRLRIKLTWDDADEIKGLIGRGETLKEIAKKYSVSSFMIYKIKAGVSWTRKRVA